MYGRRVLHATCDGRLDEVDLNNYYLSQKSTGNPGRKLKESTSIPTKMDDTNMIIVEDRRTEKLTFFC